MRVYQCEDSPEGIFTAIYNTYEDRCDRLDTVISLTQELYLFAEYIPVRTDEGKARKVMDTLRRRFGEEDFRLLCLALACEEPEKAQAVYRTITMGLEQNCGKGHLLDNLADHNVHLVFTLARGCNNEFLHLRGFLRFEELENRVLYAAFAPKNDVLAFLMPHFADRFPMENFMLYDEKRNLYGIHPAGKEWFLVRSGRNRMEEEERRLSAEEKEYQELFRFFCRELGIKERRNPELQRNMLPLHFRRYMTEFKTQ